MEGKHYAGEAELAVMKRKGGAHAPWIRARRRTAGEQMWLGSAYFSTGVAADITDEEARSIMTDLRATLPILLAGDFNRVQKWGDIDGQALCDSQQPEGPVRTACKPVSST